jgi:hypothetical protein
VLDRYVRWAAEGLRKERNILQNIDKYTDGTVKNTQMEKVLKALLPALTEAKSLEAKLALLDAVSTY